jgi:hypothetical protein
MPDATTPVVIFYYHQKVEWDTLFSHYEGQPQDSFKQLNISFKYGFSGDMSRVAKNVSVLEWDRFNEQLTFTFALANSGSDTITLGVDDILEVSEYQFVPDNLETSLDAFTELPSDITVSFDYTTARGTQKRLTGVTPAFVRPSETHAGKSILVGFTEQEDGSYARKTFRTDRITNLSRDNA